MSLRKVHILQRKVSLFLWTGKAFELKIRQGLEKLPTDQTEGQKRQCSWKRSRIDSLILMKAVTRKMFPSEDTETAAVLHWSFKLCLAITWQRADVGEKEIIFSLDFTVVFDLVHRSKVPYLKNKSVRSVSLCLHWRRFVALPINCFNDD